MPRSTASIACPRKHRQTQDLLVEGLSVFKTPQHAHQHGIPRQGELVVRIQLKDFFIVIRAILEMAAVVGGLRRPARGLRCLALCALDSALTVLAVQLHTHTRTHAHAETKTASWPFLSKDVILNETCRVPPHVAAFPNPAQRHTWLRSGSR